MKPVTRMAALLALAAVAAAVNPAGATARTTAPFVTEPITTSDGPQPVRPSIGNGVIAWAEYQPADDPNAAVATRVWTLRDGKPALVTTLPGVEVLSLEAGSDETGNPVAIVHDVRRHEHRTPFYLVRLDSGDVRRLQLDHGRRVQDVAIDSGRVVYALTSPRPYPETSRGRSSLWTARLQGSALAEPTRLRRSPRGETYETVRADRRRIAVTGYRNVHHGCCTRAVRPLYAGTAHGVWRKIGTGGIATGGTLAVNAAGFSRDGASVIETSSLPGYFHVRRVSLRTGRARKLKLEHPRSYDQIEIEAAYEPDTDRLLLSSVSEANDVGYVLGWSSVLR